MQLLVQRCDLVDISSLEDFLNIKDLEVFLDTQAVPENYVGLILRADQNGLSLSSTENSAASPTRVDFTSAALQYRLQSSKRSEGLLKAIGLDKYSLPLKIIDATAGMGTDAYVLAGMGCDVMMLEQSGIMAALLNDGLVRGRADGSSTIKAHLERMTLSFTSASDLFEQLLSGSLFDCEAQEKSQSEFVKPDVIYLDPMFPPRQKSAKVKKNMALMQQLLPVNEDVEELVEKARLCAKKRVVLKRPGKQNKHAIPQPDFQVMGKSCHFQVFLIN